MMKKLWLCALATVLLATSGCSPIVKENQERLGVSQNQNVAYDPDHYPVTIENIDSRGKREESVYTKPPERVVTVWQNSAETLLALGVGDRIVASMGIPDKKYLRLEYQAQYEKIPYTSFEVLSLEKVMMLEPDLIVGWNSSFGPKVLRSSEFWHGRGVHTYIAPASASLTEVVDGVPKRRGRVLEDEYQDILNLGRVFDRSEKAEALVGQMKDEIRYAVDRTKDLKQRPRGIIVEFIGKEIRLYNEKDLAGHILQTLGGELLVPENQSTSVEELIDLDPDVIFVVIIESSYGKEGQMLDYIYKNPAFQGLKAVKNKRIYQLPLYSIYSPGVRAYDGIKIISRGLYPELYKEES